MLDIKNYRLGRKNSGDRKKKQKQENKKFDRKYFAA